MPPLDTVLKAAAFIAFAIAALKGSIPKIDLVSLGLALLTLTLLI